VVEIKPGVADDLALVELIETPEDEPPQPTVVLDRAMPDGATYYAVGYPRREIADAVGIEGISYVGHPNQPPDGSPARLLVLEEGQAGVTSGLSGGPLLNTETGAVVAIVQYSEDTATDSGGGAIPVGRAVEFFEAVKRCVDDPPTSARQWRDLLGLADWQALGYHWEWARRLDVIVGGDQRSWHVKVDPDDADPHAITAKDLPESVSEALFKWAQRRRIRDAEEVALLGKLLAGAIFPTPVASRVLRDRLADDLVVRLHFDEDSDLFDVPWEFVAVESDGENRHLAADQRLGLVRVGPHPAADAVKTAPFQGEGRVLGIVVQPTEWQQDMPRLLYSGKDVHWPGPGEIAKELRKAVDAAERLRFIEVEDPTAADIERNLSQPSPRGASIEVVHYIGFGKVEDGEAKIAVSDRYGDVDWRRVGDLFEWVARSGARLLVVEFALPPFGTEPEPVLPRTFLDALSNKVNAVAFTRFPVHPRQFEPFNRKLYDELSTGAAVEAAVQRARREVHMLEAVGDAAGFASFTLVTGPKADMRLISAAVSSPVETGAKQQVEVMPRAEAETAGSAAGGVSFSHGA
jgi:hypothetical protein